MLKIIEKSNRSCICTNLQHIQFLEDIFENKKNLGDSLKDFSKTYQVPLDYIISGHWHSLTTGDVGINSEYISVRSIIGVNPYSYSINKVSNAGASMFVFEQGNGLVDEHHYKL